jgi:CRISPR-associated protein Csb2
MTKSIKALLAGAMTGGYRERWAEVEPSLRWLEGQPAPETEAVAAKQEGSYRISVPNNDMDVAAEKWCVGEQYDVTKLRTMKAVTPWKLDGSGPHLLYRWAKVDMGDELLAGLKTATECLHTLGWGGDAAFAFLQFGEETDDGSERVRWKPVERGGQYLSVPAEGSLDDLRQAYERFLKAVTRTDVNPDTRPMVFRQERYGCWADERACIFFDLQKVNMESSIPVTGFWRPLPRCSSTSE